ncbi:MAG TPA: hypothetical protein VGH54_28130 [Mycobacterium sp.]|uniref:hypothetical protein n=1 Tax=Mycobacterium sp. TaxID=1785 RepID=UPI002F4002A3
MPDSPYDPQNQPVPVDGFTAVVVYARDMINFVLLPETLPVFRAWLASTGKLNPDEYSAEMMRDDLETVRVYMETIPMIML